MSGCEVVPGLRLIVLSLVACCALTSPVPRTLSNTRQATSMNDAVPLDVHEDLEWHGYGVYGYATFRSLTIMDGDADTLLTFTSRVR